MDIVPEIKCCQFFILKTMPPTADSASLHSLSFGDIGSENITRDFDTTPTAPSESLTRLDKIPDSYMKFLYLRQKKEKPLKANYLNL